MDNRDKELDVQDVILTEMQAIVRHAAEPWAPGDSVKAGINRAARKLGLTYRRARTFWYGAPCAVLATEADHLRAAELRLLAERRERLTADLNEIKARLAAKDAA